MHTNAFLFCLTFILLLVTTVAQLPFPEECRPGCNNCVYACWTLHFWTPVGIDCSVCQDCVLTSLPGCVAKNKDPPVDSALCTTVCGDGGLKANCLGYAVCADDEWIPPETPTTALTRSPTQTATKGRSFAAGRDGMVTLIK
ncbi:hypothetical protein F4802DRAFT_292807 [Xylaria palmicola]|nr:hypothetical protein F4802DRAFT_292807 [Xylaria palmicola]